MNLANRTRVYVSANAAAAGTSAINGTAIDTQGFESVRFLAILGDVTATSVVTLKAQSGAASDGSDATDITGATTASFTAGASDADNKVLSLDVIKPTKRYVRPVLTRTTANAVVQAIIAELYGAHKNPPGGGDVIVEAIAQG